MISVALGLLINAGQFPGLLIIPWAKLLGKRRWKVCGGAACAEDRRDGVDAADGAVRSASGAFG